MNWELLDITSFFLFTLIFYFLGMLSKRLGEVMGMKKYYYIYYLGMALMLSGSVVMIPFFSVENPLLYGYALFALGLTTGLIASIKYWGWLFKELSKG